MDNNLNTEEVIEKKETEKRIKKEHKIQLKELRVLTIIKIVLYTAMITFIALNISMFLAPKVEYREVKLITLGVFCVAIFFMLFFRINIKHKLVPDCIAVIVAAFSSYYQIEILGFNPIFKEEIQATFINWGIIIVIYLLFYVISNRFRYAILFGSAVCFALAVTNHLVFLFRGTPFLPNDIYATETAMEVIGQMSYTITPETFLGIIPFIFNCILAFQCTYKNDTLRSHVIAKAFGTAIVCFVSYLCINTNSLSYAGTSISYWNSIKNAQANGELMQIFLYIRKSQVQRPDNYSLDNIKLIESEYNEKENDNTEIKPNVIVIMNEAFSDLSVIRDFKTNEDYFPYIHSLKDNDRVIMGDMIASIKGGGTCNTEFEFVTGLTNTFLPASFLPYQQAIHAETPSIAWVMENQGYKVLGAHPYHATGWRRSSVYPLLGMKDFASINDWPGYAEKGRLKLITDKANYQYLIDRFNQKGPDERMYIFNVTMQNHSGYSTDYAFPVPRITVEEDDFDSKAYINSEVYLTLMRQSDYAFQYLTEYFEKVDEPTIIVMFGDHQPGDMNEFLDYLSADLSDSLEDLAKLYTVPYIIWSNYDIDYRISNPEKISCNYLSSIVMDMAGVDLPAFNKFLLDLHEEYPVVSDHIVIDKNGNYFVPSDEIKNSIILQQYELLQYNDLFDIRNRNARFFYGYDKQ